MAITDLKTGETSHVGRVVGKHVEGSVRIMSDVWADLHYVVVYEPTREHTGVASTETDYQGDRDENGKLPQKHKGACGTFRMIQVYNSEFPNYKGEGYTFTVDADEEAKVAYEGWLAGRAFARKEASYDSRETQTQQERRYVEKGRWVRVVSGRKVPKGTEGLVFWLQEQSYGYGQRSTKIGIAIPQADGSFRMERKVGRYGKVFESYADVEWTYAKNVKVLSGPKGRIL